MFRTLKTWLTTARTPSHKKAMSKLGLTALEAREVPAAGVTFLGDLMVVEGYDGAQNQISVNRTSTGALGVSISTYDAGGWGGSYRTYTQTVRSLLLIRGSSR
jgi:hypothetical protein